MVPIDAAEFDAHKNINTVIVQFLCHNKGKGFSAKEIADAIGIREDEVNHAMVKLSLTELFSNNAAGIISKRSDRINKKVTLAKIEDITINGLIYYRCVEYSSD
jgi:DNA-directed RNA polymerase specialized sigma subunit